MARLYDKRRDLSEKLETVRLRVDRPDEGRLDAFLATKLAWRSRTGVKRLIDEGRARLNGEVRKGSARVRAGDVVEVDVARPEPDEPAAAPRVVILHEDDWIWALDKPSGVVVHPVGSHQEGTLLQELHRTFYDDKRGVRPMLVHRIDQQTSGVLLVAKDERARTAFADLLERGDVEKRYDALLLGRMERDETRVEEPIGPVGESRILMAVDRARGKPATSVFSVVERFAYATHAAVRIHTGRTHQIRVHAAHLGHPLLADHLYGDGIPVGDPPVLDHFALHAREVAFSHPFTGARTRIEAPLSDAFLRAVAALRAAG